MSHVAHGSNSTKITHSIHDDTSRARPGLGRESTADILEYYNSAEASEGYSAADLAHARANARSRPSTANKEGDVADHSSQMAPRDHSRQPKLASGSIRLVPATSSRSEGAESFRRPALHHTDSIHVVEDNRRVAIIERDASPLTTPPSTGSSPGSPLGGVHGNASPSILSRRGVDQSRLALVAPPDASTPYTAQASPPSAASFAMNKASRLKHATPGQTSPLSSEHSPHPSTSGTGHSRTSSEVTTMASSAVRSSLESPSNQGALPKSPKSPRDVGIIGTVRTMNRRSEENHPTPQSGRHAARERASSGSDYGDEPPVPPKGDGLASQPGFSPVFQRPPQHHEKTGRPSTATKSKDSHEGLHLPLPNRSRHFGSSPNILTPGIGDSKPIDSKVAPPVVVDIRGELADLWLAATPDSGLDFTHGAVVGSPMTATTATDSSSQPNSFSPSSSRQSSGPSPTQPTTHYSSMRDPSPNPGPMPPRRIDINALSPSPSPVPPPRPHRQPSPTKPHPGPPSRDVSAQNMHPTQELGTPNRGRAMADLGHSRPPEKYSLVTVSDDESASEYSNDIHTKGRTSSHSGQPSSLSKAGSVHIREGAFPSNSVFLHRLRTEVSAEPPEAELKTPTGREHVANIFTSVDNSLDRPTLNPPEASAVSAAMSSVSTAHTQSQQSISKSSHGRSSNDLPRRGHTSDSESSDEDERISLVRSKSLRLHSSSTKEGSTRSKHLRAVHGDDSSSPERHREDSTRIYSQTHLGHGPPPGDRGRLALAPSSFKAKGPLATTGSIRSQQSRRPRSKPPSMWPSAMSFADVLAEQTPIARARGYAMKINELATEDCGLRDWIDATINRTRPMIMSSDGPVHVGPSHTRFVSGSSAVSEMTFPMRPDAYKAIDLTPVMMDISSNEVPSTIPYPTLALRQQMTGSQVQTPTTPSSKTSLSSAVKSGPVGFLASLSRKTSVRARGSQSATESREKERSTPRKLISARSAAARSTGSNTPPSVSTPSTTVSALPALPSMTPTLPGGPRPPRPKRASTMMISAPKPIISAPIPIPPLSANPMNAEFPNTEFPNNSDEITYDSTFPIQPLTIPRDAPRPPEGPRALNRLSRTPSFHGSTRISSSGNVRSTASLKPAPSATSTGLSSAPSRPPETAHSSSRGSNEFTRAIDELSVILPNVPRDVLGGYLRRANGHSITAINYYLADDRQGTVMKPEPNFI